MFGNLSRVFLALLLLVLRGAISWSDPSLDSSSGLSLFNQGKYSEAAAALESVLVMGRAGAVDMAVLGLCYVNLGRLEDARRILDKAGSLFPSNSLVFIALGTLDFTRKEYDSAVDHFSRAYRLEPGSVQAKNGMVASLVNRGAILFQSGKVADARKAFQDALALDPRADQALRNMGIVELKDGNAKRAVELFDRALSASPSDPQLLQLLISALEAQKDRGRLIGAYTRLTKAQPENADAYAELGILLEEEGRLREAGDAFRRAEQRATEEPYPYLFLARLSLTASPAEASRLLRLAIGKAIQKAGALQAQAAQQIKEKQGTLAPEDLARLENASRAAQEPLGVFRESLGLLKSLSGSRAFEAELADFSSWYPQSQELQEALGNLYQEEGRWGDALEVWRRLLGRHPTSSAAHRGMAESLERVGNLQEASTAYLRALDLAADDPAVYDGLERVYAGLGGEEELLGKLLDRSVLDSRNPLLLRRLGLLEGRLGRTAESQAHLEQAAALEQKGK
jgi:Flp pilus assembly protein TadD